MYGEAMRNSTAQVLNDAPVTKKRVPDGLFHPSCFQHEVNITEQITAPGANGTAQSWLVKKSIKPFFIFFYFTTVREDSDEVLHRPL